MRIRTLQANPKIAQAVIARDAELEAFTREFENAASARGGQVYTIPVVFHVIHKYGTENISREQMLDGLRILNETFRKTREDTADIHPDFKPIHADTEIEFALATKDPEGNCHSGINRIASDLTNSGDHRVKELIHWDPSMYLNVYVVSNAAGLAGHAVWPSDADTIPQWDGIVISHNYVGTIGTSNLTQSVVFAHECGHYLNLHHIWGGNNVPEFYYLPVGQQANCNEDDLVGDTPNTIGWSNCVLSNASCGNIRDNVQNAMDYSYCNIMFTEGQKTRMHACLNSTIANRNNLWTPTNLLATGVVPEPTICAADFDSDEVVVCPNVDNEVTFQNTSYHGNADSLQWTFENGAPATSNAASPVVTYATPGKHAVTLQVFQNGETASITKNEHIAVLSDSSHAYPFSDSFEENPFSMERGWLESAASNNSAWSVTALAASDGNRSVFVENWDENHLTLNGLYGPPLDLTGASQMKIAFRYAYAQAEDAAGGSRLQVQISRNCETGWSTRLNLTGTGLATATPSTQAFVPDASQWQQEVVNVPSSYFEDGFRFRFVFTSNGKDRLFLDDINVDLTAGVTTRSIVDPEVLLYPNPTSDAINIRFTLNRPSDVSFSVVDPVGKVHAAQRPHHFGAGTNEHQLDVKHLGPGIYFIHVSSGVDRIVRTFIIF